MVHCCWKFINDISISAAELSKKRNELDGYELASKYDKGFQDWDFPAVVQFPPEKNMYRTFLKHQIHYR